MKGKDRKHLSIGHRLNMAIIFGLNLLCLIPSQTVCLGDTYYVDKHSLGGSCSDSNPGTIKEPWCTIGRANSVLKAGDKVFIRKGNYVGESNAIIPQHSGTQEKRIRYSNYKNEEVIITNANMGIYLPQKSYITVKGINFKNNKHFMYIIGGSYNHIESCNFEGMKEKTWMGAYIYDSSKYNWIHDCVFSRFGYVEPDTPGGQDSWSGYQDLGVVFELGSEFGEDDETSYNLIENNNFYYGGHHVVGVKGHHNVFRNNYVHNEKWMQFEGEGQKYGNRNINTAGATSRRNLIEGNRIAFAEIAPDQATASGLRISSPYNIVRFNFIYNNLIGISLGWGPSYPPPTPDNNYIYHNAFYNNGNSDTDIATVGVAIWVAGYSEVKGNVIKNNIFYKNKLRGGKVIYAIASQDLGKQTIENNWMQQGDPLFVDETSEDTFDADLPNLHLKSGSPCIDSGGFLTKTVDSGSGTKMVVEDANHFMDGWGIIEGDVIQLEGQTQTARITKVNYDNNIITIDTPLNWSGGQGVSLPYSGNAPDMGAYAYAALNYYHITGDFNYDGSVDFEDLTELATYWLDYDPLVDIAPPERDGIVNFLDFAKFAENWKY